MSISKSTSPNPIALLGNEGNIKVVEHFKYLGAFSSADGTNVKALLKQQNWQSSRGIQRVGEGLERPTS